MLRAHNFIDLGGKRFGKLTVLSEGSKNKKGCIKWLCRCDCGLTTEANGQDLRGGKTVSCGCSKHDPPPNTLNLKGQEFGSLTVLSYSHTERYHTKWLCRCRCGKTKVIFGSYLTTGKTISCGCQRLLRCQTACWKGFQEISGEFWSRIKKNAEIRQLSFEISIEYAWNQYLLQEKKCALTQIPLAFPRGKNIKGNASLDRIDNSKGYVLNNIQWLNKDINKMKNNHDQTTFIKYCCLVSLHEKECNIEYAI